jgi:putative Mg2+ transporter-C (MgtC) family protein
MIDHFWTLDFHSLTFISIVARLLLATLIGGIIGLDRETISKPAGFRTYMLICMGSALAMITNEYIVTIAFPGGDPARLGAQVISGIGFLGAGTILVIGKLKVSGLTTAAGLWASAAVGLAAGAGFYSGALIGGAFLYIVIVLIHRIDIIGKHKVNYAQICIELENISKLKGFMMSVEDDGYELTNFTLERVKETSCVYATFTVTVASEKEKISFLEKLLEVDGVMYVQDFN